MTVYSVGIWTVRPGSEDEFVARWQELADWTVGSFPEARGTLLRDRERANRFVSFGPWSSLEQVEAWRAAPEWQAAVGRIREVLEDGQTGTYDIAAESGA